MKCKKYYYTILATPTNMNYPIIFFVFLKFAPIFQELRKPGNFSSAGSFYPPFFKDQIAISNLTADPSYSYFT